MENLVESLINLFNGLGKEVVVFIISMFPLLELRGGLLAASLLKLDFLPGYIISIIGNTLPIPIVLLFLEKVLNWLKKFKTTTKFVNKIEILYGPFSDDEINYYRKRLIKDGRPIINAFQTQLICF